MLNISLYPNTTFSNLLDGSRNSQLGSLASTIETTSPRLEAMQLAFH
jgi:hypothetical protein